MRIKDVFKEDYRDVKLGGSISLGIFVLLTSFTLGDAIATGQIFSEGGIAKILLIMYVSAFPLLLSIARRRNLKKTVKYSIVSIPGAPLFGMLVFMISLLVPTSRDAGGAGAMGDLFVIMMSLSLAFVVPQLILVIGILYSRLSN